MGRQSYGSPMECMGRGSSPTPLLGREIFLVERKVIHGSPPEQDLSIDRHQEPSPVQIQHGWGQHRIEMQFAISEIAGTNQCDLE